MADKPKPTLPLRIGQQGNYYGRPGVTGGVEAIPLDTKRMNKAEQYFGDPRGGGMGKMVDWYRKPGPDDILQFRDEQSADPELLDAFREMLLRRGM